MVVAVAEDSRGAEHVRPWIEQAKAAYWCLIDPEHRVASLYGMANVPRAVWIDERGRIVRPPETAGSTDHFRNMDQKALTMSAADQAARDAGKAFYVNAVKEWVTTGRHGLDAPAAREKLPRITADIALALAHFRLGVWLRRHGAVEEGSRHLAEASRLISRRSAAQPGRSSGHACKRWVTSLTTSLPTCPASRPRVRGVAEEHR